MLGSTMFNFNRMGFNKPQMSANTRQYGNSSSTLNFDHSKDNMVHLKPEYLGNNHFNFLNNFGIQSHLIADKKFADIHSIKQPPRNFYPSSYTDSTTSSSRTRRENDEQIKMPPDNTIIPLPAGPISSAGCTTVTTTTTEAAPSSSNNNSTVEMKKRPCKTTSKKDKRKRKRHQREGRSMAMTSPRKIKNTTVANKPWHKSSLKFDIMEMEDVATAPINILESPVVQLDIETLPVYINVIESHDDQPSISPTIVTTNLSSNGFLQKLGSCRQFRLPSECESDDSFIIFDSSSTSFDSDIAETDEQRCYSSSEGDEVDEDDDDDADDVCSIISSLEDVWPPKRVRFADDKDLCEVHPMVQWSYAYQKARKGPWEQFALDRTRFQRRVSNIGSTLNAILQPEHRNKIYKERFENAS